MRKISLFVIGFGILLLVLVFWWRNNNKQANKIVGNNKSVDFSVTNVPSATRIPGLFTPPLDNSASRVTKKPFGIYITARDSPVQPEKFTGFHTGVDFETSSAEQSSTVLVKAICEGKLISKEYASGYGGVLVEACSLNNEPITVIYGHLKLVSVKFNVGDSINSGETLGELGQGYSSETDRERKHLHLGIHKGSEINILGYVSSKDELSSWIDPCEFVCGK